MQMALLFFIQYGIIVLQKSIALRQIHSFQFNRQEIRGRILGMLDGLCIESNKSNEIPYRKNDFLNMMKRELKVYAMYARFITKHVIGGKKIKTTEWTVKAEL